MMRAKSFVLSILVLAALVGCAGEQGPADQAESLAGFAMALPDEVVVGEPFSLEIRALGSAGAEPFVDFAGPVQISAEGATLSPAEIVLGAGAGSSQVTLNGPIDGRVTITATAAGHSTGVAIERLLLRELPGDPADDAAAAVPPLPLTPREEDYAAGHPELGDVGVSVDLAWVLFQDGVTVAEANAAIAAAGAVIAGGAPPIVFLRLPTTTHAGMTAALESLGADPRIARAIPDLLGGTTVVPEDNGGTPADWTWERQPQGGNWGLEKVRAPQLWNLRNHAAQSGTPAWTGVLDVGFAPHDDLVYEGGTRVRDHGTHVVGILAAVHDSLGVAGANPLGAGSVVARSSRFASGSSVFLNRISWGALVSDDLRALILDPHGVRVINVSLGYNWDDRNVDSNTSTLARTIADDAGLMTARMLDQLPQPLPLICVSAGNDSDVGTTRSALYNSPFCNAALAHDATDILVVESLEQTTGSADEVTRSWFSCEDGQISAPGSAILSTIGGNSYGLKNGTSMASPVVAGVAAFLRCVDPTLTNAELHDLLIDNAELAGGGAQDGLDAFASAADIDRLRSGEPVLTALLDLDDGSLDGNLRVDPETDEEVEDRDLDANGEGDGQVDMRDFRCWRDAVLQVEGVGTLDGEVAHKKKDLNRDKAVGAAADENRYPRADFNGDGQVSRTATMHYPGDVDAEVTDLDLLRRRFHDAHYDAADLPGLIDSGDVTIETADLLAPEDAHQVVVTIRNAGTDAAVQVRNFAAGATRQVLTLPAPAPSAGYRAEASVRDGSGAETRRVTGQAFGLTAGEDRFWQPRAVRELVAELTVPQQADAGEAFPILVRAGLRDAGGPVAYVAGITISLQVSTGSLASGGGSSNADGYFDTEAVAPESAELVTVFATVSLEGLDDVTVSADVSLTTAQVVVDAAWLRYQSSRLVQTSAQCSDGAVDPEVGLSESCSFPDPQVYQDALDLSGEVQDQKSCESSVSFGRGWGTASASASYRLTPVYDATGTYLQSLETNMTLEAAADGSCSGDEGNNFYYGAAAGNVRCYVVVAVTVESMVTAVLNTGDAVFGSIFDTQAFASIYSFHARDDSGTTLVDHQLQLGPGTYEFSFGYVADANLQCNDGPQPGHERVDPHVLLEFR